jgi:nucleotide-binding universal stress UspA family protein
VPVSYEATRDGSAAVSVVLALAAEAGAALTIASVAPQERTDVGCTHCRASAARWNQEMRVVARERLAEPDADLGLPPVSVHYLTACGQTVGVLAEAAKHDNIDGIVLPWRRAERLRRLLCPSVA